METETLLAISAGATFLLALAAFWAIWQNYNFRKEDRELNIKSRSLDEIWNWVIDIMHLMFLAHSRNEDEKWEAKERLGLVSATGASVLIAAGIFGDEMVKKVQVAVKAVDKFSEALWNTGKVKKAVFTELWKSLFEVLIVISNRKIELLPSTKDYKKK